MEYLIFSIAVSFGMTPEMAKKQVCMMVLVRVPMPDSRATFAASITKNLIFLSISSV